ncbi:MAG: hypothetical protein K940chlam8_00360 [Chlamydiae bacterium]|nr:hypothetical protein [Chlamydiota bacterium]
MAEAVKESVVPISWGEIDRVSKDEDTLTKLGGIASGIFRLYDDEEDDESFSSQLGKGLGIFDLKSGFDAYQLDRKDWKTTFLAGVLLSTGLSSLFGLLEKSAEFYTGFSNPRDNDTSKVKVSDLFDTAASACVVGMKLIDVVHFDAKKADEDFQARSLFGKDLSSVKAYYASAQFGTKITGLALATLGVLTPVLTGINLAFTQDLKNSSLVSVIGALNNKHLKTALAVIGIANKIAKVALFLFTKDEEPKEAKTPVGTFEHFVSEPKNFLDVMKVPMFLLDATNLFAENVNLKRRLQGAKDGLDSMHTRASLLTLPMHVKKVVNSETILEALVALPKLISSLEEQSRWTRGFPGLDEKIVKGLQILSLAKPGYAIYKKGTNEFGNLETVAAIAATTFGLFEKFGFKFVGVSNAKAYYSVIVSSLKVAPLLYKGYCAWKESGKEQTPQPDKPVVFDVQAQ